MTLQEAHDMLTSAGFRPGQPSAVTAAEDRAICAAAYCANCGRKGLEYHSYIHRGKWPRGGYRALAVCSDCQDAQEF
jgi:hypothetical protein